MNLLIFLPVVVCDMLLSDIQYGRFYLFELATGHSDKCGNKRRVTANYAQR